MQIKVKKPSPDEIAEAKNWSIWQKEASTFNWHYDQKEICLILEGEAEVTDNHGKSISFKKGDWVEFEKGFDCVWVIKKAIKKHYKFV